VNGNSSLHGLVNVRSVRHLHGELRAHILQQLEYNVSVQKISDMSGLRKATLTPSVPEYMQIVHRCGPQQLPVAIEICSYQISGRPSHGLTGVTERYIFEHSSPRLIQCR
jgi:hypothetical protein